MKKYIWSLGWFFFLLSLTAQDKVTVSGYVYDSETGEKLLGAEILDMASGQGTVSNEYGFYSLSIPRADSMVLQVSYLGYRTKRQVIHGREPSVRYDFYLVPGEQLDAVVIRSSVESRPERRTEMSKISLSAAQMESVPVILSEPDPIKVIQKLPGIQGGTEGMSGMLVRGGSVDQNLYLLDDVPLYYIYHLGGFVSAFNPDAINRVNIYKGDFPARYGNRLSSVLDVRTRDGNMKKRSGSGMLSLISWKLSLEGPIVEDKTSYMVSFRRMPYDLLTKAYAWIASGGEESGGYTFYDFNVKLTHRLNDRDQLSSTFYFGDDAFSYSSHYDESKEKFRIGWGNLVAALRWSRRWSGKWFSHQVFSYTRYRLMNRQVFWEDKQKEFEWKYYSGIRDWSFRSDWQYTASPEHRYEVGGGVIYHTFRPGVLHIEGDMDTEQLKFPVFVFHSFESFAYGEWKAKWSEKWQTRLGLRLSGYMTGDSRFFSPEPRFSVNYLVATHTSLKASFSAIQQNVHLLTSTGAGMPVDLWMPATSHVPPSHAWIAATGLAHSHPDNKWEFTLELYYKHMDNLIHYKPGASFLYTAINNWEDLVETKGVGTSYGLEILWRKKTGKLTGWVGYTLAKTTRRFPYLNEGKPFPFHYDRRHAIDIVANYRMSKRTTFSAAWTFGSGLPVTLPIANMPLPLWPGYTPQMHSLRFYQIYSDRGQYRMRPYHRLDVSWQFHRKKKKNREHTWIISIYNVYNRHNPLFYMVSSYNPQTGEKDPGVYQMSLFPIIPSIGYSFKF